jgi:Zn-dependent peptidase ImmA (M78 family)
MKKHGADLLRAKAIAASLVTQYHLSEAPIPIVHIAQKEGLEIAAAEFEEGLIMAGMFDVEKRQVIVNLNDQAEIRAFTIARALGHWILHKKELYEISELRVIYQHSLGGEEKSYFEKEAICFAVHLLVPADVFLHFSHFADGALAAKFLVPDFVIKIVRSDSLKP